MDNYVRFPAIKIPMPKDITITLPFKDADRETELRALSEKETDFTVVEKAALCTVSFAASELAKYLSKISKVNILYATKGKEVGGFIIDISFGGAPKSECGYSIAPLKNGVSLYGKGRVGALYAVYDFLYAQGIRWYYPGDEGEEIPIGKTMLAVPEHPVESTPDMSAGRGLDIFAPLKDSEVFLYWMARNRMNMTADHVYTATLGDKLGMTFRVGGHMFRPLLLPDKPLSNGKTIWEAHPEWYGLPESGVREKARVLKNQFCVSRPDLVDYLSDIIIKRLKNEWNHVDRLDIWGFDCVSGSSCFCEGCKKLGNDTDRAMYFLSEFRKRIDKAKIGRPITLVGCAYEGTKTMAAPTNPIPENLYKNDCIVVYPIHRCYAHDFDASSCPTNSKYMELISGWFDNDKKPLPMIMGEYYNVSKYEDLPLVFRKRIAHEIPLYHNIGFKSVTYMHPPIYNWGVRALNHLLFAELSWDKNADSDVLFNEYIERLYAPYEKEIEKVYELIEKSSEHISSYRNWWFSVLEVLQLWDGGKPKMKLDLTGHFENTDELVLRLHQDLERRCKALEITESVISQAKLEVVSSTDVTAAMTPEEVAKAISGNKLLSRLYELRRSFIYAVDEIRLFTLVTKEYLLAEREENDKELWKKIEVAYDKLSGYFYPHRYEPREIEACCDDALTRSQLRTVVDRRRAYKLKCGHFI